MKNLIKKLVLLCLIFVYLLGVKHINANSDLLPTDTNIENKIDFFYKNSFNHINYSQNFNLDFSCSNFSCVDKNSLSKSFKFENYENLIFAEISEYTEFRSKFNFHSRKKDGIFPFHYFR